MMNGDSQDNNNKADKFTVFPKYFFYVSEITQK